MNRPPIGGRRRILAGLGLVSARGGGHGEAGAGAGEAGCSGAMAVGAGRGTALGFFFAGGGLPRHGACTRRQQFDEDRVRHEALGIRVALSSQPPPTGTVCDW